MERQESSSIDRDNIDRNPHIDSDLIDSPTVTLTTPFPQSVRQTVSTLQRLQEAEKEIQAQQRKIQELTFNLEIQDAHLQNLRHAETIPRIPSIPTAPNANLETPGPHRLQTKPERPEDIAYKAKIEAQQSAEKAMGVKESEEVSKEDVMMTVFQSLTKVLKDNNQHLQSSDVTDPTKFNGLDTQWDDFYLQWRTFLEAKGWLTTFDHPTGPGTPGFDTEINKKIYNKLLALCRKGTAGTYVTKAAASNGWEAGRYLLDRYEGFSKQRATSLKNLVETIKHIHGTNMTRHIDKFERICGMMAHNSPTKPPTDEEKVDWFLNSVTEKTYDSVHAGCTDKQLDGTLTFARVVKLYTNRCFQKYPHFQLDDLTQDKKDLSNNATSFYTPYQERGKGREKGKGKQMGKGRGRGRDRQPPRNPSRSPNTRTKGKGKGRTQKGNTNNPARTFGDRKPQDLCSYCGGANHTARTCYKRQNDEKNDKSKQPHKQANLNVQIDETAMMFQQTVLSLSYSDTPNDTTRWGENDKETTDSEHNTEDEDDQGEDYEEWKENPDYYSKESIQEGEVNKEREDESLTLTTLTSDDAERECSHPDQPTKDDEGNKESTQHTAPQQNPPIKTQQDTGKQEEEKNESSSVEPEWGSSTFEPEWGRTKPKDKNEIENDLKEWEETNENGTMKTTTPIYRHGRCHICDRFTSTTNLDFNEELVCIQCKTKTSKDGEKPDLEKTDRDDEEEGGMNPTQGRGRTEKDDEEEWGRIPIPQSDDSEESTWWEGSDSDNEQVGDTTQGQDEKPARANKKEKQDSLAFLIGPRRDGTILRKDGTLLNTQDVPILTQLTPKLPKPNHTPTLERDIPETSKPRHQWTSLIMVTQHLNLKMKYKFKTKTRAKLMRAIRQHALKPVLVSNNDTKKGVTLSKLKKLSLLAYTQPSPFDIKNAYTNKQDKTYPEKGVLCQCMNAIYGPIETTPKKTRLKVKVRVAVRGTQRKKKPNNAFPIIVPGNPEQIDQAKTEKEQQDQIEDEDLTLYYKVFNRYKPEFGESNAESVARMKALEAEYQYLMMKKKKTINEPQQKRSKNTRLHSLSPSTPPTHTVQFRKRTCPKTTEHQPIEIQEDRETLYFNNVQDVPINSDYSLYPNPDKPAYNQPINIIYDTGAAISMLPAECTHAWKNLRECLHTLTGCFAGRSETNLNIGEFHGIVTLDSEETVRIIIPECIQIPPGLSNTYLLSNAAFLMAGHKYVSHLSQPKLKFKGGGSYTMSVTRGHMLISVLPTHANKETTHRTVYLHENEPYDPPTFVNNVLYQCTNRPNANTPTAFTWHLRYACKCASILKWTQQHVNGLHIQHGSLHDLDKLLPCSACLAGKMRKLNHPPNKNFTDIINLTTSVINAPLSWTPSTADKFVNPNDRISLDWGIVNKKAKANVKNVFALFLDTNTGNVFVYAAESRGQAGPALQAYIQKYGKPNAIIHDNANEFIHGDFHDICNAQGIQQIRSPPYDPNKNPVEHYMNILACMMRSMLFISGLDPEKHWEDALLQAAHIQIRTALPGRCTPFELTYGRRPDVTNLRIFGCEALSYVEKTKRSKLQPKVERAIYLGISPDHSHDTYKLLKISNREIIYRRNVYFNERSFPARKMTLPTTHTQTDNGSDLIGFDFEDDGQTWTITEIGFFEDEPVLYYKNKTTGEEEKSSVKEVRQWYNRTNLMQAANSIAPTRKGYINSLAEASYNTITKYDVQLPAYATKPTSYKKAGNSPFPQWFRAEEKEKQGFLEFTAWEQIPPAEVTAEIRKRALRCHHIYDIKRDNSAKNRVVVNGSRQHADTYTDTTSPVASQLQLRMFLAVTAFRKYDMLQLDLTNAYLHAPIVDVVYIVIPEGFEGTGQIARLKKAAYGTKQGARRFYDHTALTLSKLGLKQCPNEPCLFRYIYEGEECYLLQYVDDSLLAGTPKALKHLQTQLSKHFKCNFLKPKDFLGLDINHSQPGEITLSMQTFTTKMADVLNIEDTYPGEILTPGRTDKKIMRGENPEENKTYRSHVGTLNWLCMGIRFDIVYTTKELSRVLCEPTKVANEIVRRAILYVKRTKDAHLRYSHQAMSAFQLPATRKKPTDVTDNYETSNYNITDGITHEDDKEHIEEHKHAGPTMQIMCKTDIDLAGQTETRQSTSALMIWIQGALVHWRAHTERIVIQSTAAGEYIALSRGNTTAKFVRDILMFYGNGKPNYYLFTDNQAAEHIATQPNMNDHSRSIDIRHHAIRQDYVNGEMRIGGVGTQDNTSDILTKNLQPPLHIKHTRELHIQPENHTHRQTLSNNVLFIGSRHTPKHNEDMHELPPAFGDLIFRSNQTQRNKMPLPTHRQHVRIPCTKTLKNHPKTPNTDGAPRKHPKSAKTPYLSHTPNKSKHGDLTAQPTARRHHHTQTKIGPDLTAPRALPSKNVNTRMRNKRGRRKRGRIKCKKDKDDETISFLTILKTRLNSVINTKDFKKF